MPESPAPPPSAASDIVARARPPAAPTLRSAFLLARRSMMKRIMLVPATPNHARTAHLPGRAFSAALSGALALCVFRAGAQQACEPAFEVASVKLHVRGSGGGRSDPGRFILGGYSIAGLIAWAYGLQRPQFVGPEWIGTVLLDIDAKMPEGSTKDQIPRMLQTLLADRLKLSRLLLRPGRPTSFPRSSRNSACGSNRAAPQSRC